MSNEAWDNSFEAEQRKREMIDLGKKVLVGGAIVGGAIGAIALLSKLFGSK